MTQEDGRRPPPRAPGVALGDGSDREGESGALRRGEPPAVAPNPCEAFHVRAFTSSGGMDRDHSAVVTLSGGEGLGARQRNLAAPAHPTPTILTLGRLTILSMHPFA